MTRAAGTAARTESGLHVPAWAVCELDAASGRDRDARIRAADPACWAVLDAIGMALSGLAGDARPDGPASRQPCPPGEEAAGARDAGLPESSQVGVIVVSEHATLETLRRYAADTVSGRISPRRFVAAGPGTLVGLSCSAYGFGGPSLLLTMPSELGRSLSVELARQWLSGPRPQAEAVALVLHRRSPEGRHRAECLWLRAPDRPTREKE
jgi:hypothetical protein